MKKKGVKNGILWAIIRYFYKMLYYGHFKYIMYPIYIASLPFVIYSLRKRASKIANIRNAVEFTFNYRFLSITIAPIQVRSEIENLLKLLKKNPPQKILEIGTAKGGTFFLFTYVAASNATLVSVDIPFGKLGEGYPLWKVPLYNSFAKKNQKIRLLRADSHNPSTMEEVTKILEYFDFLFVDGDHSYDGVRADFDMYGKFVKKGGIIAFHDIVPGKVEKVGGVPEFWREIKRKYRTIEFVNDWKQGGKGIGVLFKK